MKVIRSISRYFVGTLFIFSGTIKAIDPSGTVYKFQDYFQAFNLGFLKDLSLLLTIILCTLEFTGGFSILFNIRQKTGVLIVMLLMILFTPLTFVLALTNPVSDCGCFGDAIKLTNWQTFLKNIILIIPVAYLFFTRKEIVPHSGATREYVVLSVMIVLFNSFIFYNLRYLPLIDFLPYRTGTNIPEKMIIPEGKPVDKYKTTFIYEKNGERKEFSLDNYPAADTTWKFIEQKSVLISKGYQPPVHDLVFTSTENQNLTRQILDSQGYTILMVSKKLNECDPGLLKKGFNLGYYCMNNLIDFYVLTASGSDEVRNYNNGIKFCFTDETTLKTMIRSNPGYILMKNGTILEKWSWANIPDPQIITEIINKH